MQIGSEIQPVVIVGDTRSPPYDQRERHGIVTRLKPALAANFSWIWIEGTDPSRMVIIDQLFVNQNVANKYFVGWMIQPSVGIGSATPGPAFDATLGFGELPIRMGTAHNVSSAFGQNIINAISFASVAQPILPGPFVLKFLDTGQPLGLIVHGEPVNTDLYVTAWVRDVPLVT